MDATKREIRNLECQLSFREATPDEASQGNLGTISGRAICFNVESQIIDEKGQTFREVIDPSAASMAFLNTQDIKINLLHVRELTFGRCKRGESGNARLSVDREGVNFEVDVPNCDVGIRARELTRAGVYDGCSFEFYPEKYDVKEGTNNIPVVRHTKFRAITALTLGMDPAYLHTSLSARELVESTDTYKARKADEEKQQAEREAEEKARIAEDMKRRERVLAMNAIEDEELDKIHY